MNNQPPSAMLLQQAKKIATFQVFICSVAMRPVNALYK